MEIARGRVSEERDRTRSHERDMMKENKRDRDNEDMDRVKIRDDKKSWDRNRVKERVRDSEFKDRVRTRDREGVREEDRKKEKDKREQEREGKEMRERERKRERERDSERKRKKGKQDKGEQERQKKEDREREKRTSDEGNERGREREKRLNDQSEDDEDYTKETDYPPFRKNFYVEVKEIANLSSEEVFTYREKLALKVNGVRIPKPIHTWHQIGLSTSILDTMKKLNFEKPMPVQCQALPIIMSGRDCVGVAKKGSSKTLAFVLPMLMHIKDQPPLISGDGPIGLIMAPTREIVQQIHSDIIKFIKPLGLTCVAFCGGSGVAQQIDELNRGAEIVVCTPDRIMDISAGKVTNLRRVTYLVIDEATRMLDMGFERQITNITRNTRPDRHTLLFSATFSAYVEWLARKVLIKSVTVKVGGQSVINKDVTQLVEVRPKDQRFLRLLELLVEWYEKGKILIFVDSEDKCYALFKYLLGHRYPCLSLHSEGQTDRGSIISDFKNNVCNLLVVNSDAARCLGLKELELVINFDVPNYYEDYVQSICRAGQVDRKGFAITFISEDKARYAPYLVRALQRSKQVVPDDLKALADEFMSKEVPQCCTLGISDDRTGFKLNEEEEEARKAEKKTQAKKYGFENENENVEVRKVLASAAALAAASKATSASSLHGGEHYEDKLEINDYPWQVKWKVTHKDTLELLSKCTGADITIRGQYFPPGKIAGPCDLKQYLFIVGPTEQSVTMAKAQLREKLENFCYGKWKNIPFARDVGQYGTAQRCG